MVWLFILFLRVLTQTGITEPLNGNFRILRCNYLSNCTSDSDILRYIDTPGEFLTFSMGCHQTSPSESFFGNCEVTGGTTYYVQYIYNTSSNCSTTPIFPSSQSPVQTGIISHSAPPQHDQEFLCGDLSNVPSILTTSSYVGGDIHGSQDGSCSGDTVGVSYEKIGSCLPDENPSGTGNKIICVDTLATYQSYSTPDCVGGTGSSYVEMPENSCVAPNTDFPWDLNVTNGCEYLCTGICLSNPNSICVNGQCYCKSGWKTEPYCNETEYEQPEELNFFILSKTHYQGHGCDDNSITSFADIFGFMFGYQDIGCWGDGYGGSWLGVCETDENGDHYIVKYPYASPDCSGNTVGHKVMTFLSSSTCYLTPFEDFTLGCGTGDPGTYPSVIFGETFVIGRAFLPGYSCVEQAFGGNLHMRKAACFNYERGVTRKYYSQMMNCKDGLTVHTNYTGADCVDERENYAEVFTSGTCQPTTETSILNWDVYSDFVCTYDCDEGCRTSKSAKLCLDGTCICEDLYTGDICENIFCDPTCNDTNGKCVENSGEWRIHECECNDGWDGETCDSPICDPVCGEFGNCTAPNTCSCSDGSVVVNTLCANGYVRGFLMWIVVVIFVLFL